MLLRLVRRGGPPVDPKTGKPKPSLGKFSLIDLAGSERGADNENTDKVTQLEGRQINQSLLALKEVIRAKELGRSHAPFRQSRLTQVLEESLTGRRCQTVVIGCVSPAEKDIQQSINTLRYAEGLRPGLKKGGDHRRRRRWLSPLRPRASITIH
jgi:kinesin family protein 2/24